MGFDTQYYMKLWQGKWFVDDANVRTQAYLPRLINCIANDLTFEETALQFQQAGGGDGEREAYRYRGKVRDRYDLENRVVLVTTDRLSAFDRSLGCIPSKGAVLNLTSRWWFEQTKHIVPNHVLDVDDPVHPNVTLAVRCKPFPIEFVMRGYITGSSGTSMWTHYENGVRNYCGHALPGGMVKNQKLWTNLLTPTTKSDEHDELISAEEVVAPLVGFMTRKDWDYCAEKAHALFAFGQATAAKRGLILVDTKYEFGRDLQTGKILLIDEIHTQDSSRYWLLSTYDDCMARGVAPDNIDKEFIRLWYKDHCDPYQDAQLPSAPKEMLAELGRRYIMLYEIITGEQFQFPEGDSTDINADIQRRLRRSLGRPCGGGVSTPLVGVIMGSDSDLPCMIAAVKVLESFEVPYEVTIVSAHRTPQRMYEYARTAKTRGLKCIIAGAGGASHLPGMVAAITPLPVIGVPVKTSTLSGVDSLYSIVQMPRGVPVATVAIGNAKNAGLLAVRMLAISDEALYDKLVQSVSDSSTEVGQKAGVMEEIGAHEYLAKYY